MPWSEFPIVPSYPHICSAMVGVPHRPLPSLPTAGPSSRRGSLQGAACGVYEPMSLRLGVRLIDSPPQGQATTSRGQHAVGRTLHLGPVTRVTKKRRRSTAEFRTSLNLAEFRTACGGADAVGGAGALSHPLTHTLSHHLSPSHTLSHPRTPSHTLSHPACGGADAGGGSDAGAPTVASNRAPTVACC